MNIVYSFIGKLPEYTVYSIFQIRLFFKGDIYLIIDDLSSPHLKKLMSFNVIIIEYEKVLKEQEKLLFDKNKHKIPINNDLGDRRLLFMRSMERFFLLNNLILLKNLKNCLFLEIDNLIYSDPCMWKLDELVERFAFMYDDIARISTGVFFVKGYNEMKPFIENLTDFIEKDHDHFFSEMTANWRIREKGFFLPTHWESEEYNILSHKNYSHFNDSIFDSAAIGIHLIGVDKMHLHHHRDKIDPWKASEINYTKYKYKWEEDEYGRKIPYVFNGNKKILINNLHIHNKALDLALSKNMNNIEIITGEKFQYLADHYLSKKIFFDESYCTYNPTLKNSKKIIYEDLRESFDNKKIIHIEVELLYDNDIINKLNYFNNPFILICHNCDFSFKKEHLVLFEKVKNIIKIITKNCEVRDKRVFPIPIGLANSKWPHGDLKLFSKKINSIPNKTKDIYFNFNISTNPGARGLCRNILLKKYRLKWIDTMNYENYLDNLSHYKFCICPPGNGIDCHRLWECLYLRVVPICEKSIVTEEFSKTFHIILVDDWKQFRKCDLNYEKYSWENYAKLNFGWWKDKILNY